MAAREGELDATPPRFPLGSGRPFLRSPPRRVAAWRFHDATLLANQKRLGNVVSMTPAPSVGRLGNLDATLRFGDPWLPRLPERERGVGRHVLLPRLLVAEAKRGVVW